MFFSFWPFFHCRKATKMTQNSISIPSCAQTPKNPRKMSKTPPYSGLGAKPFLAPPTKADIATAILTNVIEHLVLLFCPPISTPSPPKRCGRIFCYFVVTCVGILLHFFYSLFVIFLSFSCRFLIQRGWLDPEPFFVMFFHIFWCFCHVFALPRPGVIFSVYFFAFSIPKMTNK